VKRCIVFLFGLLACGIVLANEAAPLAENEAVEKRMIAITQDLRCLVCQNESLAASQADLAKDLREEVRQLVKQNKSDQEIKEYLVNRYGDFVLYKPPVKPTTWALWGGPFVLMVGGVAVLILYLRRRGNRVEAAHLSDDERKQAETLLKEGRS
jgi:cytochrome c-type biogenesis protein CcmH